MRQRKNAKVAEIAAHWYMTTDAVRTILKSAGIEPVSTGPELYRWADIWAYEGAGWVAPADEAAFKAPLMKASELGEFFSNVPTRTITDRALNEKIPGIKLGTDWRFRKITLERWQDHG
jgi:hypothetical protein